MRYFPHIVALLLLGAAPCLGAWGDESQYHSPLDILLAPDGKRAYAVNHTSGTVSVLDVAGREALYEIYVGSAPAQAALAPDGRVLYVTRRYADDVAVVDLKKRRVMRSLRTGLEPYGLLLSADGKRLYVANSQSDSVSIIDVESGETVVEAPVKREPRFIAATPDGKKLIVANGLGRGVSILDAADGRVLEHRSLSRASNLRQLAVSPDGRWAYVNHVVGHDEVPTLQLERGWINSNGFSVLDLSKPGHRVTLLLDHLLDGAANPWGMALSADGKRLYISLSGAHEIAIVDTAKALALVEKTAGDAVRHLEENVEIVRQLGIARRVKVEGLVPRGVALNEKAGEFYAANYYSDDISVLDAETGAVRARIPLGPAQDMTLYRKGSLLINDAGYCFQRWYSCASCHQEDATMDGLNWDLHNDGLQNPKNAKSLHDAVDTPPAMWTTVRDSMVEGIKGGQRFLGFLPRQDRHDALVEFLGNPPRAPNPWLRHTEPEVIERGRELFSRALCVTCHPPPTYTDMKMYKLGLRGVLDQRDDFDTPSLRETYRTAPYLHDGRAETLRAIFTDHNPKDLHGITSDMTPQELDDLIAFVKTL
ncbi:MAG: beta-propeller fold lactonase family protein [Elusimicrobiota bacterium]